MPSVQIPPAPQRSAGSAPRPLMVLALVLAISVLVSGGSESAAGEPVRARRGKVTIDWTAGIMTAPGAAAGDLRTPSATVARVGAERRARQTARATLRDAARKLRLEGSDTVGTRLDRDPAAADRFRAILERTRSRAIRYSTDGSVMLEEALPLEAIRLAVLGAAQPPKASAGAPTAVIVDLSSSGAGTDGGRSSPGLGLALVGGAGGSVARYAGPTVFYRSKAQALGDSRLGANVAHISAAGVADGAMVVDGEPDVAAALVARLSRAGALVVIVLPRKSR